MNKILIIEDDAAYGLTISNWAKKNGAFKMEAKFISNVPTYRSS